MPKALTPANDSEVRRDFLVAGMRIGSVEDAHDNGRNVLEEPREAACVVKMINS